MLPAIMLYKRRMLLIQKMARKFIMRLRRAYEYNFSLWDKVAPPNTHTQLFSQPHNCLP